MRCARKDPAAMNTDLEEDLLYFIRRSRYGMTNQDLYDKIPYDVTKNEIYISLKALMRKSLVTKECKTKRHIASNNIRMSYKSGD